MAPTEVIILREEELVVFSNTSEDLYSDLSSEDGYRKKRLSSRLSPLQGRLNTTDILKKQIILRNVIFLPNIFLGVFGVPLIS